MTDLIYGEIQTRRTFDSFSLSSSIDEYDYSGFIIKDVVLEEEPIFGQPLYYSLSAQGWKFASALSIDTMICKAIYLHPDDVLGLSVLLIYGILYNPAWSFTNKYIYVSAQAGQLTQTPPSQTNSIVQQIGLIEKLPNIIYFNFESTWLLSI